MNVSCHLQALAGIDCARRRYRRTVDLDANQCYSQAIQGPMYKSIRMMEDWKAEECVFDIIPAPWPMSRSWSAVRDTVLDVAGRTFARPAD